MDDTALSDIATNGKLLNQTISGLIQAVTNLNNIVLPIANGGTGAATAAAAFTNLIAGNVLPVANGGTGITSNSFGAWTAYTPTITAGTGTFTTVAGSGRWAQIGKVVFGTVTVTVTTNGTAAGHVIFTLPTTAHATNLMIGNGRENASSGKLLQTYVDGTATQASVFNYDNTYPAADGSSLLVSFTYEAA
jgi:hypothetical protein